MFTFLQSRNGTMDYGTIVQQEDPEDKKLSPWQSLQVEEEEKSNSRDNSSWSWEIQLSSSPSPRKVSNGKIHNNNRQRRRLPLAFVAAILVVVLLLCVVFLFRGLENNGDECWVRGISYGGENAETYDYIVVGGGPSGIIVATKLARKLENTSSRILLLESGTVTQSSVKENLENLERTSSGRVTHPPPSRGFAWADDQGGPQLNQFDIPLMWSGVASSQGRLSYSSDDDDTQHHLWSSHHWPIRKTLLARALGGCGLHNAMLYVRALSSDMEKWNMTQWKFENLLEYYKDLETYVDTNWAKPDLFNSTLRHETWRGGNGPIWTVPAGPSMDRVGNLFVQSSKETIGIAKTQGFNDPDPAARLGAGYYEFNIRNGVRDSVAQAFLGSMWNIDDDDDDSSHKQKKILYKNLDIRTGATVTRVYFGDNDKEGDFPQARGVGYIDLDGRSHRVLLKSGKGPEVILASGAIMTPQLLVNSGIGEKGSVADLPGVGKNLQDHPVVAMAFQLSSNLTQHSSSMYTMGEELEDYFASVAELTTTNGNDSTMRRRQKIHRQMGTIGTAGFSAGAFLQSPWARARDSGPDIQLTVFPRSIEPHVTRKQRQSDTKFMRSSAMLVTVALLDADARYEVQPATGGVQTMEAADSPFIDTMLPYDENPLTKSWNIQLPSINLPKDKTEYLSDLDVQRLVWGIQQVRNIQKTPPLSKYTLGEVFPRQTNEADLKAFIKQHHTPNSHWGGSTKMGKDGDPMAVLDEFLRVRKVQGLRVVDSGAMPTIPNGNTHSTVCAVASRAADFILEEREMTTN